MHPRRVFLGFEEHEAIKTIVYCSREFPQTNLLVANIVARRLLAMYIDGSEDSIRRYVQAFKLTSMEETIKQAKAHLKVVRIQFTTIIACKSVSTARD